MSKRRAHRGDFESVDHFDEVLGISVGGANEKNILEDPETGERYIAKLGRRNNDIEVMTEYAVFLIGKSLGVSIAEARIARYRGRLRFLSRYFLDITKPEELVHGLQLFKELYDEDKVKGVLGDSTQEQRMFSVQAIKAAFGAHYMQYGALVEEDLFDGFVSMLTHDALIGVQDRHHENWGIIVAREVGGPAPRFAPLYDSARGLFCNRRDSELSSFTGREGSQRLDGYIARAKPLVGFDGLQPIEGRKHITHEQLVAAVFHSYPTQRHRIISILEAYDWKRVRSDLTNGLRGLCIPSRTTLVLTCLRRRLRTLRRALNPRAT